MRETVRSAVLLTLLCGATNVGCLPPLDTGVESWEGEELHFVAQGELGGEVIDVAVEGLGDAQTTGRVWCVRSYVVPKDDLGQLDYANGVLEHLVVNVLVSIEGEPRRLVVDLRGQDFKRGEPGTQFAVVPFDELVALESDEVSLEVEWYDADEQLLSESAAQEGQFDLELFTGDPGADGLVIPEQEGSIGGYFSARWGARELMTVSFTAQCTENVVEQEM